MDLGFGDRAGGRVRAREVLAKLSGGRREGRCASLQTRGSQPRAQAGGGRVRVSARPGRRRRSCGALHNAFGVSVCKSKTSRKRKITKAPKLISALGNQPLHQAFLQEPGNGQCELNACWIVRSDARPPGGAILHTSFVGSVCVCLFWKFGGSMTPPCFFLIKVECWEKLTLFPLS